MLADMAMKVEAARVLTYRALAACDAGDPTHDVPLERREVLRVGRGHGGHDRRRADPRRLRLRPRVPGRAVHARREDHADLRGDEPDPAAGDRSGAAEGCWTSRGASVLGVQPVELLHEQLLLRAAPGLGALLLVASGSARRSAACRARPFLVGRSTSSVGGTFGLTDGPPSGRNTRNAEPPPSRFSILVQPPCISTKRAMTGLSEPSDDGSGSSTEIRAPPSMGPSRTVMALPVAVRSPQKRSRPAMTCSTRSESTPTTNGWLSTGRRDRRRCRTHRRRASAALRGRSA